MPRPDPTITGRRVRLLEADATLLPDPDDQARRHLTAPLLRLPKGAWTVPETLECERDRWLGLLLLDGLLVRTVRLGELECCELLGPGDVIRPWDRDDVATLAPGASWRVVEATQLAVLDEAFARLACRWPQVLTQVMERSVRRSRSLTVQLAIAQARRADVRLLTLFWHLGDRWGRVTGDGVVVELDLTHGLLSRLTSLRRPTVSGALTQLRETGELTRLSRRAWLLRGSRPSERQRALGVPASA